MKDSIKQLLDVAEKRVKECEINPDWIYLQNETEKTLLKARALMLQCNEYGDETELKQRWISIVDKLNQVRYSSIRN